MILLLTTVIVVIAAGIVMVRSICIINRLHWRTFGKSYLHFLVFGSSYILLATGALIAAIDALHGALPLPGVLVVIASAGLILFDKRSARTEWGK